MDYNMDELPEDQIGEDGSEEAGEVDSGEVVVEIQDAVHEEAFDDMSELVSKFPKTMITGDDLTVTNKNILKKAIEKKSCNATILKVIA